MAFDLADELPDLAGGSLRLLALNADERHFLFLVREVNVEHGIGDERNADHSDKQDDVFDEQAAAHDRGADRWSAGDAPRHRALAAMIGVRLHQTILTLSSHSITSSASARKLGGSSRPIDFAVFKLTTNRYLVGSSNGKSAGLAPLKNPIDQGGGAFEGFFEIGAIGHQAAVADEEIVFIDCR